MKTSYQRLFCVQVWVIIPFFFQLSKIIFFNFLKISKLGVGSANWKKLSWIAEIFTSLFFWSHSATIKTPPFADFQKSKIRLILCLNMLNVNWARVFTNAGHWLSPRDRIITRNITLARNASFSNWF